MKKTISILILLVLSHIVYSQSWGTTNPQVAGGYDVQYIPGLNTTYASGGGNIVTLSHDTVTSTIAGPSVNKFRYFFNTLYAATNGSNSFRYLNTAWEVVPNVTLDSRSFYLDTLASNILILSESSEPYPGHVIEYDGSTASTIPGLDIYTNSDHSITYGGKKFISYISSFTEAHLLAWDGQVSTTADIPDNHAITSLFVANSNLYATLFMSGSSQLWGFDGSAWQYVLTLPNTFNCQGVFCDSNTVYFYGSNLYKCVLPDTTVVHVENPITNSIYAMTKDSSTGIFYISSNYIFWWDGTAAVTTGLPAAQTPTTAMFKFDISTNMLSVDYDKEWLVFNCLGQTVANGNGKTKKKLGYLSPGTYIITAPEASWAHNKFIIAQ